MAEKAATDWRTLVGQHVHIQENGRTIRTGYVDTVTAAGDVLWIRSWGAEPRAMYEKASGHTVCQVAE